MCLNVHIDADELFKTGLAIQEVFDNDTIDPNTLRAVATAYFKYYTTQKKNKHKNFHGTQ